MFAKIRPLVLVAFVFAALAACGVPAEQSPTPSPSPSPTPTPAVEGPEWLLELIEQFEMAEPASPPLSVTEYLYQGQTVYFVPQRCCDIYSDLYDAEGNLIAHPDGGIAGDGDGRAPDFAETAELVRVIWADGRA
ncbi:MAG: hypothetical protein WD533_01895 [Dehalococcoidia bacterium]